MPQLEGHAKRRRDPWRSVFQQQLHLEGGPIKEYQKSATSEENSGVPLVKMAKIQVYSRLKLFPIKQNELKMEWTPWDVRHGQAELRQPFVVTVEEIFIHQSSTEFNVVFSFFQHSTYQKIEDKK